MARWFDDAAKRAARRAGTPSPVTPLSTGLSRREVLARGAVVAGVAWTAPLLLATQAAAAGVSTCTSPDFICGSTGKTQLCCASGTTCVTDVDGNGTSCAALHEVNGSCGNEGVGVCASPYKCNGNADHCNNCGDPNICGGEGAECGGNADCGSEAGVQLVCVSQGDGHSYCRKPCTTATVSTACTSGQVCSPSGYCAKACTRSSQCTGGADCVSGICTYAFNAAH